MRNEAIKKLTDARSRLADEIASVIADIDLGEELVGGYSNSVDQLLEMGDRLVKLTYIIAAMPHDEDGNFSEGTYLVDGTPNTHVVQAEAEAYYNTALGRPFRNSSWDSYLSNLAAQDIDSAARDLAALITLDPILAKRATVHFMRLVTEDYIGTMGKLSTIRSQVALGNTGSVELIRELFGLPLNLATHAFRRLKETA